MGLALIVGILVLVILFVVSMVPVLAESSGISVIGLLGVAGVAWLWISTWSSDSSSSTTGKGRSAARPLPLAWCEPCGDERRVVKGRMITLASGKLAIRGRCERCGHTITSIPPKRQGSSRRRPPNMSGLEDVRPGS